MPRCALVRAWPHKRGQRQFPKAKWQARVRSAAKTVEAYSQVGWMSWKKSQSVYQTRSRVSSQNEGQVRREGGIGWGLVHSMGRIGLSSFLSEKEYLFPIHGYVWVTWYEPRNLAAGQSTSERQFTSPTLTHNVMFRCIFLSRKRYQND